MFKYYVNKQTNGNPNYNHEVHTEYCRYLPSIENRVYLGIFASCSEAVKRQEWYILTVTGVQFVAPNVISSEV